MATARPFAYNTGSTISGTIQVGSLAVGTPTAGFEATGLAWWNGPDEDLGYVIAGPVPSNTQPTPISGVTASVQFWRSQLYTENSFIEIAEYVTGQKFATGNDASNYLTTNGYWNSWGLPTPTPTPTNTPTPTVTPTITPTSTLTPTPTVTPTITPTNTVTPTPTPSQSPRVQYLVGYDLTNSRNTGYSYDGTSWFTGNTSSSFIGSVRALTSNGNMWVIGGINGSKTLGYSYDGLNWSAMTNSSLLEGYCENILWDGSQWWAMGGTSSTAQGLATSTDGITWTNNSFSGVGTTCLGYNGSRYVLGIQSSPYIKYSDDGTTWNNGSGMSNIFYPTSIVSNGSVWVASTFPSSASATRLYYSYDGISWSASTNGNSIFGTANITLYPRDVIWNGSFFLAVGNGSPNRIAKSTDGITWTGCTTPFTVNYEVTWDGTNFYDAGLPDDGIAYSTDGNSWTTVSFSVNSSSNIYFTIASLKTPNTIPPIT